MISLVVRLLRKTFNNNFWYLIVREILFESSSILFLCVYCFSQPIKDRMKAIFYCKEENDTSTFIKLMEEDNSNEISNDESNSNINTL